MIDGFQLSHVLLRMTLLQTEHTQLQMHDPCMIITYREESVSLAAFRMLSPSLADPPNIVLQPFAHVQSLWRG